MSRLVWDGKEEGVGIEGDKDKGNQTPNLPAQNMVARKGKKVTGHYGVAHAEHVQEIDQDAADDNVEHQVGDAQSRMLVAETIQPILNGTQEYDLLTRWDRIHLVYSTRFWGISLQQTVNNSLLLFRQESIIM